MNHINFLLCIIFLKCEIITHEILYQILWYMHFKHHAVLYEEAYYRHQHKDSNIVTIIGLAVARIIIKLPSMFIFCH